MKYIEVAIIFDSKTRTAIYNVVLSPISLSSNRFCLILAKALFLQTGRRADE